MIFSRSEQHHPKAVFHERWFVEDMPVVVDSCFKGLLSLFTVLLFLAFLICRLRAGFLPVAWDDESKRKLLWRHRWGEV